ncbi:Asp/Glu racemase [Ruegeria sp. HKCCD6228]|jgi:maleate isomerase/arylmalonate decarboxylase|uniref:maleate cis-trans isomerase family protein n=1 Tax=unclassified Ruegeria TaxID=2625375 RepID=UPI001489AC2A|nr:MULTISPECIES: Asp/Glu racemase [unclassified Ruegeria]NOC92449.1 Asp/Glu racemase [Ruegeria sp. HKCCD6604]NOD97760.1 Asp/Glu racemase [Ruegeria sp. HKCCD6228]
MTETRTAAKIGVLVPFTNTNLEPDMEMLRPPNTTIHFQRMGGYDVNEIPGSDQMAGLGASDISHDLRMISGVRPDVVLYGCTSATLTHGPSFDAELAQQIKSESGALSLTAAGSLIAAIKALGATKVGFSSPYLGEINAQAMDFMAQNGIETVRCADVGRKLGNYGQGELTPDDVYELACQADHPQAQAIILSCTDMRSVEAVDRIEATLGKPVVTSNQAMMFCLMRALNLPRHDALPGRLFDLL